MNIRKELKEYTTAPIPRHLVLNMLSKYKRPNDKISELIKSKELISIRRGLYIPGPELDLPSPDPFLIANHLRGPSYISLDSALSYWGLIPERVYEISSVTTKTPKKYSTEVGRFSYKQIKTPYYALGIKRVSIAPRQIVMIASREKALCDKIVLSPKVNFRSVKQTKSYLIEDLRIDTELLSTMDSQLLGSWIQFIPKKSSLKMLLKTLAGL